MRALELLAPAKDVATGIAAIDCGADAVYIGAEKYGARAAAGNSVDDIAHLVTYAHHFRAKVYVTINTLLYDDEIDDVRHLLAQLNNIGVDALIVQDMALLSLTGGGGGGMALHASTQTDIRSAEMVGWLKERGFKRVIVARELSLAEIEALHAAHPDVEVEVFVHGALCVSYSGACYVSQHLFGRSANRGACCHVCRMKFDLVDSAGQVIRRGSHLLSLKDLSLIDHLSSLAAAGVTAFKIEGRLKDIAYVKNVVSAYSQALDDICRRAPGTYCRAAIGEVDYAFTPNLDKTFTRGYTDYFFAGRQRDIYTPSTPKARGEKVGTVLAVDAGSILVAATATFANGDGLCFINADDEMEGFRVNRAEGCRLFPYVLPSSLRKGMVLYRNNDASFTKLLAGAVAVRRIPLHLTFASVPGGFVLRADSPSLPPQEVAVAFAHTPAKKSQRENILAQLSRWGGTIYKVQEVTIEEDAARWFVPSSVLSSLRQTLCQHLDASSPLPVPSSSAVSSPSAVSSSSTVKHKNVANALAEEQYAAWGIADYLPAPEVAGAVPSLPLMQCKHCLRYALGHCEKAGDPRPTWQEPLFLRLMDGRRLRLSFDCRACQMNVWAADDMRK